MATLELLQAKIRKLERQAEALIAKQASGVIEKIRDLMAKHGLTTADISTQVGGKRSSTKFAGKAVSKSNVAVAKYHDPKTGATWTGHGRAPNWIATAKNRDKFLVDASAATVKPAPVSKAKAAGKYVRGPQPAMYRNPKSGAIWTGRGRAPGWIADVKDRSKFLISSSADGARAASVNTTASKAKTAVKKAAVVAGAGAHRGQRKGPQPAKYLDPKTGATWSGRGPAPAWLAAAKDRSKFLIAGADAVATETTATSKASKPKSLAVSGAVAKKAATKKGVAKKAVAGKASTVATGAKFTT